MTAIAKRLPVSIIAVLLAAALPMQAQVDVYSKTYTTAMADGVISPDEKALLKSLQHTLGLTDDQVLGVVQSYSVMEDTPDATSISHAGRRSIIAVSMSYGNGLYGWGIPYVLGVEAPQVYAGMQMLSFAGGFYYSWKTTSNMNLPEARATFLNAGSLTAALSLLPLMEVVGFDEWKSFDPDFKIGLLYLMAAVPTGYYYGNRLYQRWQPSHGQAQVVLGSAWLGVAHAAVAHYLVTDLDQKPTDSWFRVNGMMLTAGYIGSSRMAWNIYRDKSVSIGDAYFLGLGAALGYVNALQLLPVLDMTEKPSVAFVVASIDAGLLAVHRLGRERDLTIGQAAIVGLGSTAGWATLRGIAFMFDMDQGSHGLLVGDVLARTAGAYLTFRRIDTSGHQKASVDDKIKISLSPALMGMGNRPVIGLSAGLHFI